MAQLSSLETLQLRVGGMDCGDCARTIEASLQQMPGVAEASANFATGRVGVSYDPQQLDEAAIQKRIAKLGYRVELGVPTPACEPHNTPDHADCSTPSKAQTPVQAGVEKLQSPDLTGWRFWLSNRRGQGVLLSGVGLLLGLIAQQWALSVWVPRAFYGLGMLAAGWPIARAGWLALSARRADMNLLMTVAAIGAALLGDWLEGAMVVFLFSSGTTLQSLALGRTRNAIRALINLTPPTATVKRGDQEVTVPVETIGLGEVLTVRPGQRVALDGTIVSGHSAVDQAPITGESIPVDKAPGDSVFAGTLNQAGFLEVKVTHRANDTTVARIIHRVEEAQASRAPSQQWVDRFAEIYTPLVIGSAMLIALLPPLVFAQPLQVWVYRALVLLVIACPCALVIATPVSIVSAIGAASRQGVLFKGGNALEMAGKLHTLAFDKTGTLTSGLPVVQQVLGVGDIGSAQVFQIAASLEQYSEHPLAKAIVAEARVRGLELDPVAQFQALPGKGIRGRLNGQVYWVGSPRLLSENSVPLSSPAKLLLAQIESQGQTPLLVATETGLLGAVTLADGLRLEATEAVAQLKRVGVNRLVMLTGDRTSVARQISKQVGLSNYQAELLPEDKLQAIESLRRLGPVGMVGDGINDAPALAAADVSFAVGSTDVALETADVVLVGSDLRRLSYAVDLSRRTVSVIQQNIAVSLVTKGLFLLLGSFGVVGLAVAVLADTGTSLLVTLNGMRLFRVRS